MGEIMYQQYVCRGVVHILADHLTLSQPGGGTDYAHNSIMGLVWI